MANTYTQLYFQIVFPVKNRDALIQKAWQGQLHAYITGIVQKQGHKMMCINSMPSYSSLNWIQSHKAAARFNGTHQNEFQ